MAEDNFDEIARTILTSIKSSKSKFDTELKKIQDEYDTDKLILRVPLTNNKNLIYEKIIKLKPNIPPEQQTYSDFAINFLGYAYKINLALVKNNFKSDKKDSIIITAQIKDYLNKDVEIKEKIFFKYDNIIYEKETDENGKCSFEIKTIQDSRIIITTVNSNMLNSNIVIDAK